MPRPADQTGDTRTRIMEAASSHFAERGFDGARTQAIADEAGVNKAMLYYHFRDKEHLYIEILSNNLIEIFSQIFPTFLQQELPVRERLLRIAAAYHLFLSTHPQLRALILQELAAGGARLGDVLEKVTGSVPGLDIEQVFMGIRSLMDSGELRQGDPRQVLLHLLSLTIFPFFARPLLETIWGLSPPEFEEVMKDRPAAVADLLDQGLFTRQEVR